MPSTDDNADEDQFEYLSHSFFIILSEVNFESLGINEFNENKQN